MKTELSKIAQDLEQGTITDSEARTLLLVLLGVSNSVFIVCENDKRKLVKQINIVKPNLFVM